MKTAEPRLTPVSRTSSLTWAMMTLLVFAACALACGLPMPELGPSPEGLIPGVKPPASGPKPLTCNNLSFERQSGSPLDQVGFSWQGSKASSFAVIVRHETGDYLTTAQRVEGGEDWRLSVPFHPELFEGGQVGLEVVLIEETEDDARQVSCGVYPFEVEGIKRAPGTMAKIIERSEQLLSLRAQSLGFDLETLREGDLSKMPMMLYGPAYAAYMLNDPNNSRSLAAIVEGSNPELEVLHQEVERAEAILAHVGYVELMDGNLEVQRQVNEAFATSPLKFKEVALVNEQALQGASACKLINVKVPVIETPDDLHRAMVQSDLMLKRTKDSFTTGINAIATMLGLIPNPAVQAAALLTQLVIFVNQQQADMYAKQLPSYLSEGSLEVTPRLDEGREVLGRWDKHAVYASSLGWDARRLFIEGLVMLISSADALRGIFQGFKILKGGRVEELKALNLKPDHGLKEDEILKELDLDDLNQIYEGLGKGELANLVNNFTKAVDDQLKAFEPCKVNAHKWGPFDLGSPRYSELVYEGAIRGTSERRQFEAFKVGVGLVQLRVKAEMFPPKENVRRSAVLEQVVVEPVTVQIVPGSGRLPKGEQGLVLTAQVERTDDLGVSWEIARPVDAAGISLAPMSDDEYGRSRVRLLASSTSTASIVLVRATSTSQQGLRGRDDAPPRDDVAAYMSKTSVVVSPLRTCITPSESIQLKATVMGHEDQRVRWSSDGGRVDESGSFSASKQGVYKVTATSAADPSASERATIEVKADCACRWSSLISGPGAASWGNTTDIHMTYTQGQLDVLLFDEQGNMVNLKALNGVYGSREDLDANVSWGQLGRYRAQAIFGAAKNVDSIFGDLTTLETGPQWMTITRWDDNYIEGFYEGSVSVFGTGLLPPSQQVHANVEVYFTGYVQDASNILNLVTSKVCP